MSYRYTDLRASLFTEEGQTRVLQAAKAARYLLEQSGAVRAAELMGRLTGVTTNWDQMAAIDRLVELKMLREITSSDVAGQDRVFVEGSEQL